MDRVLVVRPSDISHRRHASGRVAWHDGGVSTDPAVPSARRPMVLDGGMGRELLRIGAPFQQPEWSALALWDGPEWVVQAHTNFIDAGAEMVTTNSYALVPFHIGEERFVAQGRDLASLSGRLARQAVADAGRPITVAGSLPPLFGSYRPDLFVAALRQLLADPAALAARGAAGRTWVEAAASPAAVARAYEELVHRLPGCRHIRSDGR